MAFCVRHEALGAPPLAYPEPTATERVSGSPPQRCYDASTDHCVAIVVATQPPIRPHTNPNIGARHSSTTVAPMKNTVSDGVGHVTAAFSMAVLTPVVMGASTAIDPPRRPARDPAASGSIERVAAMNPAMNAPMIPIPPARFTSASGSQFTTTVRGSEASVPMSATRQASGRVRVWTNDGDIRVGQLAGSRYMTVVDSSLEANTRAC